MLWTVLGVSLVSMAAAGATLGAAMGLTGLIILKFFANGATDTAMFTVWDLMNNFTFSAVPMFILLGDLLVASGLSRRIYGAVAPLFERVPGQLLHSNIAVSTLFGAVSGSSAATSAAVGAVAYPELSRRGYHLPSVAASLAAGGTLGLLIPPSLSLLIYRRLAGGLGRQALHGGRPSRADDGGAVHGVDRCRQLCAVRTTSRARPRRSRWGPLLRGLVDLWPIVILIGAVLGTIYFGLATATEAAGLGVFATIVIGFTRRRTHPEAASSTPRSSRRSASAPSPSSCIGAAILAQSVTILGLPRDIVEFARGFQMSKYEVLVFVVVFYLVMGIFFDGISLMLTTVPFIYPVMKAVGFDPVWIGVFVTIMIEIGMLTPPIGVNLFVILAIARNKVSLNELSLECLPYWIMLLLGTLIMTLVPDVALLLPRLAY